MNLKLVGLLDSPQVRRVAIAFQFMELEFEHIPLSAFLKYHEFARINPVVKSPTLVLGDSTVMMDSSMILQFASSLSRNSWFACPQQTSFRAQRLKLEGLALVAIEKAIQLVYETQLRPTEKQFEPFRHRVELQLRKAIGILEQEMSLSNWDFSRRPPDMAQVTIACAWTFCTQTIPKAIDECLYPALRRFAANAESLPEFRRAAHSERAYPTTIEHTNNAIA